MPCECSVFDICGPYPGECNTQLQESLNAFDLWDMVERHETRGTKSGELLRVYQALINKLGEGQGKKSFLQQTQRADYKDKFQKLQCQEDMAAELLELLESKLPAAEDTLSQQAGENVDVARASTCSRLLPQRRHKQKSSAKSEIRNPFSLQKMIVREVSYSYKSNVIRARKYAPEPSCQNLGNVFLAAVLSHTTDLDIENCCFSLLLQLLDFMKPVQKHWSAMRDILVDCAQNRSRVIANKLGLPQSQGKYLLMKLLNGGQENAAAVSFLSMAGMHSSSGCL